MPVEASKAAATRAAVKLRIMSISCGFFLHGLAVSNRKWARRGGISNIDWCSVRSRRQIVWGSGLVPALLAQDATDEQTTYGPEQRDDDDNFVHC